MDPTRPALLLWLLPLVAACGEDAAESEAESEGEAVEFGGPVGALRVDEERTYEALSAPVHVVRDALGVPHIYAFNASDAAFANGLVMAQDRLAQMELGRRQGSGTLAEFAGSLVAPDDLPELLADDLEMRMHGFRRFAEESVALVRESDDPIDQELIAALDSFAAGVNAWFELLRSGERPTPAVIGRFIDPARLQPWTPTDSLVFGYLMVWSLSFDDHALETTALLEQARATFDEADPVEAPALAARAGLASDLFRFEPAARASTVVGFPNVENDSGSRAGERRGGAPAPLRRPRVPLDLLRGARRFLGERRSPGWGLVGSNNWVVSGALTDTGNPMLANDPHLTLDNPPIWYQVHVDLGRATEDGPNVAGVSLPGVPGVILGYNAHVAWGATVVAHDVTDYYLETVEPCGAGGGDCAVFEGARVPIEAREETIGIGALGTLLDEASFTLETVPHHGPILPVWQDGQIVPRAGGQALSVRFTGYAPSKQIRAFWRANRARDAEEAAAAFAEFDVGGQNWVIIDAQTIRWTTHALVPVLPPEAKTFHATDNPEGAAPFLVLPGTGEAEWQGWLDSRYIPHAVEPTEGFLVTANADPVGATFDNDPLDGPAVDGNPLYVGYAYDAGFRTARIQARLRALVEDGGRITFEDMQSVQADAHSSLGERLRSFLSAAVEKANPGEPRLVEAAARFQAWSLDTPAAVEGSPSEDEVADSVATSIFNVFLTFFVPSVFDDELAAMGWDEGVSDQHVVRALLFLLERPEEAASGLHTETGDPVVFDDLGTAEPESRDDRIVDALARALDWLASEDGFGSEDMDDWRWGHLHRVLLESVIPEEELDLPPPDAPEALRGGYPRHGDNFSVDASHPGMQDRDFRYGHGPSMRHAVEMTADGPRAVNVLPGGEAYDPASSHFADQVDAWRANQAFPALFDEDEVARNAAWHLVLSPP